MDETSRGRLSRWSQRKTEARKTEILEKVSLQENANDVVLQENTKDPGLGDLPPLDTLNADSDFTKFLRTDVPPILKKAALRKLWTSDPVLANVDGLNDYDEDFAKMGLGKAVKTAYQVGKGMINQMAETENAQDAVSNKAQKMAENQPSEEEETSGEVDPEKAFNTNPTPKVES